LPARIAKSAVLGGALTVTAGLSLLAALYHANSNWFYTPAGWLDSFISVGIGLHYADPAYANDYYKISYLPWNLLQFVVRSIFSENSGQIILHFFLFGAQAWLVWLSCLRFFSSTTAVIMALFACAFPLLISARWMGGSDYQTALSSPLFFGAMASIATFNGRNTVASGAVLGAVLAALITTNWMYLNMLPFIVGVAAMRVLERGGRWLTLAHALTWTALGTGGAIAALSFIHAAAGRGFLFFLPAARFVLMKLGNPTDTDWEPITLERLMDVQHFGVFIGWGLAALTEVTLVFATRSLRSQRMAVTIHVLFLFELIVWTWWHVAGNQPTLLPTYMAYPLYGPLIMSMAATVHRCVGDRGAAGFFAALILLPPLFVIGLLHSGRLLGLMPFHSQSAFVAICVLGVYAVLLALRPGAPALAALLLLLPLANAAAGDSTSFTPTACRFNAALNRYLISSAVYVSGLTLKSTDVFVGFSDETLDLPENCRAIGLVRASDVGNSFAMMLGLSYIDPEAWQKPRPISEVPLDRLRVTGGPDALFAVVSNDATAPARLIARFSEAGVGIERLGRIEPGYHSPLPPIFLLRSASEPRVRP
jgi:hypothetical protein